MADRDRTAEEPRAVTDARPARRTRVAFYLRFLDQHFQALVFNGAKEEAERRGIDLLCVQCDSFPGITHLDPTSPYFHLPRYSGTDGALILTSVMMFRDGESGAAAREVDGIPAVSVGRDIAGLTSITIDSRHSMSVLMNHLIVDHGYRKLLFITGPQDHPDSVAREKGYYDAVSAHANSLPGLSTVVVRGDFLEDSAFQGIKEFIRSNPNADIDAVVAANDDMAIGAVKALRLADDRKWRRCAITGFDDTPRAASQIPALTSVHQPLEEMGTLAMQKLLDRLQGLSVSEHYTVDTVPIFRDSCGCPAPTFSEGGRKTASLRSRFETLQTREWQFTRHQQLINELGASLIQALSLRETLEHLTAFLREVRVETLHLLLLNDGEDMRKGMDGERRGRLIYSLEGSHAAIYGYESPQVTRYAGQPAAQGARGACTADPRAAPASGGASAACMRGTSRSASSSTRPRTRHTSRSQPWRCTWPTRSSG